MCTSEQPLALIEAGLTSLLEADVVASPDSTMRDELAQLLTVANQVQAAVLARLASFDRRDLAQADGLRTSRAWLCGFARLSPHAATGLVRRARLLRELPAVAQAAADGHVTSEHLTKLVTLAEDIGLGPVQQVQQILADLATVGSPAQLQQACDRIRAHADPDGPDPDPAPDRRFLTLARSGDVIRLRGQLDLDAGATLLAALDALMRPPTPDDLRTPAQRRADALTDLAQLSLHTDHLPTTGGGRPHLALLVTPDHLTGAPIGLTTSPGDPYPDQPHLAHPATTNQPNDPPPGPTTPDPDPLTAAGIPPLPPPPWLDWAGPIPTTTAQRLACDSVLYRILYDPTTGQPLDVGRTHRTAPAWLRKALHARDHGCRWPGCDAPIPYTDAHHLTPWSEGGSTSIDTMLLLCRWHHTTVHEGQWKLHHDTTTGTVHVTRPDGTPYELNPTRRWLNPQPRAA